MRTTWICVWIGLAVGLNGCRTPEPTFQAGPAQSCNSPACQRKIDYNLTQINTPAKRVYRAQVASSPYPGSTAPANP